MLRKLHLSQMRRESRSRIQPHFLVEYDSAETGLHMIDPRDRLQAQEELRRVCHYACTRKETSKAGSVLILRFFHGYYPSEITKVIRGSRQAVDLRLRRARAEAKASLANPEGLVFMNEKPAPDIRGNLLGQSTVNLLAELRHTIFRSRHGDCLSVEQLHALYEPHSEAPIKCETLAHIVSCQPCLDEVNKMYDLPYLSERYAVDTMGKDDSSKGGGPGEGTGGGVSDKGVARCRRRAREVFEHRPQELHISVNGFIQGSQKVNSEQSEQTLDIVMAEQIGFVEVFSEQETRLLFLDVEPPPYGPVEQGTRVELSNERLLELTLSFRGPWPTLHTIYRDPLLRAERETESDLEQELSVTEPALPHSQETAGKGSWRTIVPGAVAKLRRSLGKGSFWLRPGIVTATVALILIVAVLSLYVRVLPPVVTAADLLQRSTQAEEAIASRPDTVLHRTLQLEERSSSGDLIARNRVEVWQSAERGVMARRLYNEKNTLVAGDWRRKDGVQTLYQHGVRPELQLAPEKREGQVAISFDGVWQRSVSARDFTALIGGPYRALVEETPDTYVIRYANEGENANARGLIRAALVVRRNDLHPVEQTLTVSDGNEVRDYRLTETSFEHRASSAVESSVFEPEPELVGPAKPETRNAKPDTLAPTPKLPTPVVASAELEVEVLRLIHQAKADMGEQVSVTRRADGILRVEGIFDNDQRKTEILRELQPVMNNPAVKVDVQTVSEALKRQSEPRQSAGQITIQPPESTANTVPVEDELRRYFAAKGFKNAQIDDEVRRFSGYRLADISWSATHNEITFRYTGSYVSRPGSKVPPPATYGVHLGTWIRSAMSPTESLRSKDDALELWVDEAFDRPPMLLGRDRGGLNSYIIWDPNPQLASIALGKVSLYHWKDQGGYSWSGILALPADYEPKRQYPLVIQTHGYNVEQYFVDGMYTTGSGGRALTAKQIVVLQMDQPTMNIRTPREGPFQMGGFEAAIEHLTADGVVDPRRVGVIGFSFTCFHTLYALTHHPGLFAAATITDGNNMSYSQYIFDETGGAYQQISEETNGGVPWGQGLMNWASRAPDFNLDKVETPLLISALERGQLLRQWEPYAGLRRLGKPVDMLWLRHEDAIHLLVRPAHRYISQQSAVDWFDFWLNGHEDPDPTKAEQYARWRELRKLQEKSEATRRAGSKQ